MRLIDADALYEQIVKKEESARQRVLDTPSRMPNGNFNPSEVRYATQLDERTQTKFMIADAPTVDAIPIEWMLNSWDSKELEDVGYQVMRRIIADWAERK